MGEFRSGLPPTPTEWAAKLAETVGGWAILIIIGIGIWIWYNGGIEKTLFSLKYSVPPASVHVDPRPNDCDFTHAPLGDKGCHYKAVIAAYNSVGVLVAGDLAPEERFHDVDHKVSKLTVTWVKVED
jgi:hypothetical protein